MRIEVTTVENGETKVSHAIIFPHGPALVPLAVERAFEQANDELLDRAEGTFAA